jgi:rhomboid protease GluP
VPVVTWTILGVNLLFLLVEAAFSGSARGLVSPSGGALCRLGALNSAAIAESGQWWRLFTVMVLHAGILHFAVNSWALWIFGPVLEQLLGRFRFVLLYLVSGLSASALSLSLRHTELAVGASGAIFGLLGALIAFFLRRRAHPGSQGQLRNLLFVLAVNLLLGARIPGVDNTAHIGGLLGGFATMTLLDLAARRRDLEALAYAIPTAIAIGLVVWGVQTFSGGFNCATGLS